MLIGLRCLKICMAAVRFTKTKMFLSTSRDWPGFGEKRPFYAPRGFTWLPSLESRLLTRTQDFYSLCRCACAPCVHSKGCDRDAVKPSNWTSPSIDGKGRCGQMGCKPPSQELWEQNEGEQLRARLAGGRGEQPRPVLQVS